MGTETHQQQHDRLIQILCSVKLNNPLMGTETPSGKRQLF